MRNALIYRIKKRLTSKRQKHYVDIRLPEAVHNQKAEPICKETHEPEEKEQTVVTDIGGMKIRTDKGKANAMERKIYCIKCKKEVTMNVKKTVGFDKEAKTPVVTMSARCPKCGTAASTENIEK